MHFRVLQPANFVKQTVRRRHHLTRHTAAALLASPSPLRVSGESITLLLSITSWRIVTGYCGYNFGERLPALDW
jgi:hypothetical protein